MQVSDDLACLVGFVPVIEGSAVYGTYEKAVEARYAGWQTPFGQDLMAGRLGLDQVAARALARNQDTRPVSGRQEQLENLLNSYL